MKSITISIRVDVPDYVSAKNVKDTTKRLIDIGREDALDTANDIIMDESSRETAETVLKYKFHNPVVIRTIKKPGK